MRAADVLTCARMIRAAAGARDGRAAWRPLKAGECDLITRGARPAVAAATADACRAIGGALRARILAAGWAA